MAKRNAIESEAPAAPPGWEVDPGTPAPPLSEGYTYCPECKASFQGDVCPGCSPGIDVVAAPEGCPACTVESGIIEDGKCQNCGREIMAETLPTEDAPLSIRTKEIKETLKCILTETEILEISRRGSRAHAEILQIEEELQAVKSQFKFRTDTAIAIRTDCAQKVNNGYEFRPVDCEMVLNYDAATVLVTRLDTFETVSRRTMSREEMQRKLF